jgi:hypothetical protein
VEIIEIAAKVVAILGFLGGVIGFCVKVWKEIKAAKEGDMCLLRKGMLDTYNKYKNTKIIPEYEAKNFMLMYDAYKARGGNSFIDEVHDHVITWELEI